MISSLNDLQLVPLERLILHEAHDPDRLRSLRDRIEQEGAQRNPVMVAPYEKDYLVLDGAHRVQALKELGLRLVLVQLVEPAEKAESWGHVLDGSEVDSLREIEGVEATGEDAEGWLAGIENASGERVFVRAREKSLEGEARALWEIQALYPAGVVVHRVDPDAPIELEKGEAIIRYRPFMPPELVELVRRGLVLPAGITRFRVRERVLGVRYPLEKMRNGDAEKRNAELRNFVRGRWNENRVRYYGEPVVVFE